MSNLAVDQRIRVEHQQRTAVVYARQSTAEQLRTHTESTRLQLGLRDKALELGWAEATVIDDDLGVSAGGFSERPGFQRLLSLVATRKVGILLCFEAARLSRNSADWAHLFQLCGYFDTLVADLSQIYDLARPNDRLVLGIKGVVAEMELSVMRTRMGLGREAKAARGELKFAIPPGYVHDHNGHIVLDPNRRVREAIADLFERFETATSMRQLALHYRDTDTPLPVRKGRGTHTLCWQVPNASTLRTLLAHPIYAGVYVYGRRQSSVEYVDGKLVQRVGPQLPTDLARVCIRDHHPGYISWERYQANLAKIAESRPRWTMQENRGAIREGLALLSGLLRCRHCGRRILVAYKAGSAHYYCHGGQRQGTKRCLSFGSKAIDQRVSEELLHALEPLAIEASLAAADQYQREAERDVEQARLRLQDAEYQADRAREQYDHVDPKNRLVAESLEQRWNEKLTERKAAEQHLERLLAGVQPLSQQDRRRLQELAENLPAVWNHPEADTALRKQILRTAIHEILVAHEPEQQRLEVTIHWQGGAHTQLHVSKRKTPRGSKADASLIELVRELATELDDAQIARILNMKQLLTPQQLSWTKDRVVSFRRHHRIRLGSGPQDPDLLTGQQAAQYLGISRNGLTGLLRAGAVHKRQLTDFAPWRISKAELASERVQRIVRVLKQTGRIPRELVSSSDQLPIFPDELP
jgi:DNA invertase Pin-like site-specific DNA recombinase